MKKLMWFNIVMIVSFSGMIGSIYLAQDLGHPIIASFTGLATLNLIILTLGQFFDSF